MKVGILSMQKVMNFGSFLQAYALKKTIESLGHDVFFVDIRKGRNLYEDQVRRQKLSLKDKFDRYFLKRLYLVEYLRKRKQMYNILFDEQGINNPVKEENCDAIVIGSDEVFNCKQRSNWGFSTQLMGDVNCNKKISYAASFANTCYEDIVNLGIKGEVIDSLNKLDHVSVRDIYADELYLKLTGKKPFVNVDPVFLYDFKEVKKQNKYRDYILVYGYDNHICNPNEIEAIKRFAKEKHKKLISFGWYQFWCDKNVLCTPFELLSYFDDADYVITDTFHGTVMSIVRNKKFVTIVRKNNTNKLSDLLERFHLKERRLDNPVFLAETVEKDIDWLTVNRTIETYRNEAISYLKKGLGE